MYIYIYTMYVYVYVYIYIYNMCIQYIHIYGICMDNHIYICINVLYTRITSITGTISSSAVPNQQGCFCLALWPFLNSHASWLWEWHFHTRRCQFVQGDAIRDHQATIILLFSGWTHGTHAPAGLHCLHPNWWFMKLRVYHSIIVVININIESSS